MPHKASDRTLKERRKIREILIEQKGRKKMKNIKYLFIEYTQSRGLSLGSRLQKS
jgi:hypothetical protein